MRFGGQIDELADGLVLELDRFGDLAGFWLIDIPPCPPLS